MISLQHKYDCCGCNACVQKCPKQCISMSEDNEGFLYPHIDESICIDCHLCEKVCPVINQANPRTPIYCYAAYNPNEHIRRESSSGGVFTLLAEKVLSVNGVVFGVAWNEKWQAIHTYSESVAGLAQFRGSKYIQSIVGDSYKQAEILLKQGRMVLFSGTPCQIAGLKLFLKKEYMNLVTVDFICHGVPSPGVFRTYLQEELYKRTTGNERCNPFIPNNPLVQPEGINLNNISFRDKCSGWKNFSFKYTYTKDCQEHSVAESVGNNTFLKGFLADLYLRPSCHTCPAKQLKSGSDITLADYWGYHDTEVLKDDDKGISAVLINTDKGVRLYNALSLFCCHTAFEDIVKMNGAIEHSSTFPYREYFYRQYKKPLVDAVNRITSQNLKDKILRKLFLLLHQQTLK